MSMAENKTLGGGIVIERQTGSASPAAARNGQRHLNAALSVALLAVRGEPRRFSLGRLWMPLLPALALVGFLVVQMLPLGGVSFATAISTSRCST